MAWSYQRAAPYRPGQVAAYKVSRSKIGLYLDCQRCFWLDRRLGISQPGGFPFTLNNAVDELLKREFDIHRAAQTKHPLSEAYGLPYVPLKDKRMEEWRDARRRGIQFLHTPTNILVTGGIDDVWIDPKSGELIIVDYKATSKAGEVNLDAEWQKSYKRQMEIYQWLFRQNGFKVSTTGYFVYCNGKKDSPSFDAKLEFDIKLVPYDGNDDWIEKALMDIKQCLDGDIPKESSDCEYCTYAKSRTELTLNVLQSRK